MNGYEHHLLTLATLKAQLEESRQLLAARERAANRFVSKHRKAAECLLNATQGDPHEYLHWPLMSDASIAHAEAINALDDLAVAYLRMGEAATAIGNHVQDGIRAKYYE